MSIREMFLLLMDENYESLTGAGHAGVRPALFSESQVTYENLPTLHKRQGCRFGFTQYFMLISV